VGVFPQRWGKAAILKTFCFFCIAPIANVHPTAYQQLVAIEFAVQRSKGNTYGCMPHDQTIEVTINKDTKTQGAIIGISLKPGAVFKWMVLRADRAEYSRQCEELAGSTPTNDSTTHKDAGKKCMQDDEAVVQRIAGVVENWIDPFQSDEQLCHFASGLVATEEMKTDLLNAHDKGLEALRSFADQTLGNGEDGTKDFYSTLPQLQLMTFSSMRKNKRCSEATQASVLKFTRDLFGHILVIGQTRELSMEKLLSYPLAPSPLHCHPRWRSHQNSEGDTTQGIRRRCRATDYFSTQCSLDS